MRKTFKKPASLETARRKSAYSFVLPWIIGLIMFFYIPLGRSIWFAFCETAVEPGKIVTNFVGITNFRWLLSEDADFLDQMMSSIAYMFYSFPLITAFSLVIALILNTKFRGRAIVRTLFLLPILIMTSAVLPILGGSSVRLPIFYNEGTVNTQLLIENLGIPQALQTFVAFLFGSATKITYHSAVQILLFLGGLQNIPASLYEVSKIEGANKWEEFWMVTFPSLRHVTSLVMMYTMIDLFANSDNTVVERSYEYIMTQDYANSSAMMWFYFVIVIAVIGLVFWVFNRFCMKRWE